jgi:hypothetical protein
MSSPECNEQLITVITRAAPLQRQVLPQRPINPSTMWNSMHCRLAWHDETTTCCMPRSWPPMAKGSPTVRAAAAAQSSNSRVTLSSRFSSRPPHLAQGQGCTPGPARTPPGEGPAWQTALPCSSGRWPRGPATFQAAHSPGTLLQAPSTPPRPPPSGNMTSVTWWQRPAAWLRHAGDRSIGFIHTHTHTHISSLCMLTPGQHHVSNTSAYCIIPSSIASRPHQWQQPSTEGSAQLSSAQPGPGPAECFRRVNK